MKELIVRYQYNPTPSWSPHIIFNKIYDALVSTHKDITFTRVEEHFINKPSDWTYYVNPHVMGIENPITGKKIIVSYADNNKGMFLKDTQFGWNPKTIVQAFISSDYRTIVHALTNKLDRSFVEFSQHDIDVTIPPSVFVPFSYPVWSVPFGTTIVPQLYSSRETLALSKNRKQELHFRGLLWEPRAAILHSGTHPEIHYTGERLCDLEYGKELLQYRCGISLNGNAEICNRDIELMSLGIPILRPTLICSETHVPLIPNYHYIAFDFEREPLNAAVYPGAPLNYNSKLVWDAMVTRWEEVKHDYDYLDFVGNNGRLWYEQHGEYDQHVKLFMNKVNLSLLT